MTNEERKEFDRIRNLSNEDLLEEFETSLRKGAGELYIPIIWMRNEITKRMEYGELV